VSWSHTRIVYRSSGFTAKQARDARARAWVFIFDCSQRKPPLVRAAKTRCKNLRIDRATSKGAMARFGFIILPVDRKRFKSKGTQKENPVVPSQATAGQIRK
jgi:hypothetical protein